MGLEYLPHIFTIKQQPQPQPQPTHNPQPQRQRLIQGTEKDLEPQNLHKVDKS